MVIIVLFLDMNFVRVELLLCFMCLLLPDFGFYVSLITAWQLNVSYGHLVGLGRVFNRFADNLSFLSYLKIPDQTPSPLSIYM